MRDDNEWLVSQLREVPGITRVLVASDDGLPKSAAGVESQADLERMAAALSAIRSATKGAAPLVGGSGESWKQTLVEFEEGWLIITRAGVGTSLMVATAEDADLEAVGYQMQHWVNRLGQEMSVQPRATGSGRPQ